MKALVVVSVVSFGAASCHGGDDCARMGEDVFANLESVVGLAARLKLPTTESEAAVIVGAAIAVSDLGGGESVEVCLRAGDADEAEFRVLSAGENPLDRWTKTSLLVRRGEPVQ